MSVVARVSQAPEGKPHDRLRALPPSSPQPGEGSRVLIIVQNLPVPFDRRIWLECQTLTGAGYQVAVVCPKGPGDPGYAVLDGVELYKYRPYAPGGGKASFVIEYLYSFLATLFLTVKAARKGRFDAIQSANPPDIFWPIGLLFRAVHGSRFVFDHHDLSPETYQSRFPGGPKLILLALRFLERRTVRSADHVIATTTPIADGHTTGQGQPGPSYSCQDRP